MAYTIGPAANYKDLLSILATFAAANGWTILDQSTERLYLRGEGLAGEDEIYVGVQTYEDAANGRYNWELFGSWAYRAGRAYSAMPRSSGSEKQFCYLWNSSIPYWFVATPRRIMGFAKVGTTYTCFHLGLLDQPATDAQYPYPLLIGGCGNTKAQNYSATTTNGAFWAGNSINGCGRLALHSGSWGTLTNNGASNSDFSCKSVTSMFSNKDSIITGLGESYLLLPFYVVDITNPNTYGAIDGLFWVSGYNNTAENIITVSGKNYMVFPDVYRSNYGAYCCMRLD